MKQRTLKRTIMVLLTFNLGVMLSSGAFADTASSGTKSTPPSVCTVLALCGAQTDKGGGTTHSM
jgi:hypothetical protein